MSNRSNVTDICIAWANAKILMTWAQYPAGGDSTLFNYAYGNVRERPQPNATTILSCWELPLLALVAGEYYDADGLKSILERGGWDNPRFLMPKWFPNIKTYSREIALKKGYLAFFDGMSHVALFTGERNANGDAVVISFWAHTFAPGAHPPQGPVPETPVEFNTIESLQDLMVARRLAVTRPNVQVADTFW